MSDLQPHGVRTATSFLHYKNLVLTASLLKTQLSSIQSDQHNGELVYISSARVYLMHFFIRSIQYCNTCLFRFRLIQVAVCYAFTEYLPQYAPSIQCTDPVQLRYTDSIRAIEQF